MTTRLGPALALLVSVGLASSARAAAPAPPTVTISSIKVSEGDTGKTEFKAQVLYGLGFGGFPQTTVDVTAVPGTATAADFVFETAHLTLMQGVAQEVRGYVLGDTAFEGDETFALHATPTGGAFGWTTDGTVTIIDDDGDAATRLSIEASPKVIEGNTGWHTLAVPVSLSRAVPYVVSVAYATNGGRSDEGPMPDYGATSGTLTFAAGETSKTLSVEIYGDTVYEPDTTFNIALSDPRGALLLNTLATVTIVNDDAGTMVTIDDLRVVEGDAGSTAASLHIHFAPPTPGVSKLFLSIAGDTATAGQDFDGDGATTLYPTPGTTDMIYTVNIHGDTTPECNETILIKYQGLYIADDQPHLARITIVDDETAARSADSCPLYVSPPDADTMMPDDWTPSPPPPPGPDGGTPPAPAPDSGTKSDPPGQVGHLPGRAGCACDAAGRSPSSCFGALALGFALLAARRRRRATRAR